MQCFLDPQTTSASADLEMAKYLISLPFTPGKYYTNTHKTYYIHTCLQKMWQMICFIRYRYWIQQMKYQIRPLTLVFPITVYSQYTNWPKNNNVPSIYDKQKYMICHHLASQTQIKAAADSTCLHGHCHQEQLPFQLSLVYSTDQMLSMHYTPSAQ